MITMNTKKIKILAVDDEIGILNFIKEALIYHEVTIETSSLKAAELIQKEEFNIFIVDYQMPQLNGIELLELIREKYEGKNYVSIFCTASGTLYLFKEEFTQNLFQYFIEKPFELAEFQQTINQAVVKFLKMRK